MQGAGVEVGTLKTAAAEVDINNPSAVKVVTDAAGRAFIFRAQRYRMIATGCVRDTTSILGSMAIVRVRWTGSCAGGVVSRAQRTTGAVALSRDGVPIYVAKQPFDTVGVDTESDVRLVEEILKKNL